ncbi:flagellar protein [bacterium D16-50]|jgi:flagellar operon protein|nr:flagellar protein [Lachnospiraceae bacterium]RKJ18602.1 flagellar protein [bacterium D16-50]
MNIQNNGYLSIAQLTDQHLNKSQRTQATEGAESLSFQEILRQKALPGTGNLKFSKHAMGRLADRNIELSDSQLERLQSAAQKAGQKGIRDSLVIMDQLAFIVNVPNQTVVTAMDSTETMDNIFTNINGAVII